MPVQNALQMATRADTNGRKAARRSTKACDTCHRRGRRCQASVDSTSCLFCLHHGLSCTWNRIPAKRGPKPKIGKHDMNACVTDVSRHLEDKWHLDDRIHGSRALLTVLVRSYFDFVYPMYAFFQLTALVSFMSFIFCFPPPPKKKPFFLFFFPPCLGSFVFLFSSFFIQTFFLFLVFLYCVSHFFFTAKLSFLIYLCLTLKDGRSNYVHEQTFMERWNTGHFPASKSSYGLIMAMCSLTAYRIQNGIAPAEPDLAQQLRPEIYLREARSSIDLSLSVTKETEDLQAIALLCMTGLEMGDAALLQQYLGLYHGTVATQSLYDEKRWPTSMSPMEKEQCRRLYWYMYRLEVHTALVMGHPVRSPELQSLVAYPEIPDYDGGGIGDSSNAGEAPAGKMSSG